MNTIYFISFVVLGVITLASIAAVILGIIYNKQKH